MCIFKYLLRGSFIIFWMALIYALLFMPYLPFFGQEQKYLCVYTWADRIDETVLQEFEKKTGIKVYLNHYESNEELVTKLEHMSYVDCDIIIPSGYIIPTMVNSQLIKKIDQSKCDFIKTIYPEFLHRSFDPENEYSVPLYWDVLGIGFNNKKITGPISLKMVFEPESYSIKHLGMIDDARQSIVLTALYAGFSLESLSKEQLKKIRGILNKQKLWVGAYSDTQQGYYLLSDTFPLIVSDRLYICKQMLQNDFISFAIPQEGSLMSIDNIVISSSTQKDDLIYELINYLFSAQVFKEHAELFCVLPTRKDVFESLDKRTIGVEGLEPGSEVFSRLHFFENILSAKQINDLWVRLKSA